MKHTLVFPLDWKTVSKQRFSEVIQFARTNQINRIVLFMQIIAEQMKLDDVYFKLLELNGHYQANVNHWQPIPLTIETVIESKDTETALMNFIEKEHPQWIVVSTEAPYIGLSTLTNSARSNIQTVNL